jgi:hypothetical protein
MDDRTLRERITAGREMLAKITGKDFGYDLAKWHTHLKESRQGGYTWGQYAVRKLQDKPNRVEEGI